jgi:beta-glucosidase-like glycosyl hydrolase
LRRALLTRNQLAVLFLHWRFQPALDVENHPWKPRRFGRP